MGRGVVVKMNSRPASLSSDCGALSWRAARQVLRLRLSLTDSASARACLSNYPPLSCDGLWCKLTLKNGVFFLSLLFLSISLFMLSSSLSLFSFC